MKRHNLIPKALAYSKNVRAIENHSFQAWLAEQVRKEDLIWWAQKDDTQKVTGVIPPSRLYEPVKRESFFRKLSALIP